MQGKDEPLKDYLARWIKLRNTCEGVHEIQAIQYLTDGCLDGSMLKHKLLCKEVQTLAELMKIANAFAISDTAMRPIRLSANGLIQEQSAAPQSAQASGSGPNRQERRNNNNNNNNNNGKKRKDGQPDAQYGNR